MNNIKENDILKQNTKVMISGSGIIGIIDGDDRETCDISNNGEIIDLNYFILPKGKTSSNDYVTVLFTEVTVLKECICPNCGKYHESKFGVYKDDLGEYAICPHCGSSADSEMYFEQ